MSMPVAAITKSATMGPAVCFQMRAAIDCARARYIRMPQERKIRVPSTAVVGRLRKAFPQLQDLLHEPPPPGIVEVAQVAQKAAEGEPAVGLNDLRLLAAAKQQHACGARLECGCCIVKG